MLFLSSPPEALKHRSKPTKSHSPTFSGPSFVLLLVQRMAMECLWCFTGLFISPERSEFPHGVGEWHQHEFPTLLSFYQGTMAIVFVVGSWWAPRLCKVCLYEMMFDHFSDQLGSRNERIVPCEEGIASARTCFECLSRFCSNLFVTFWSDPSAPKREETWVLTCEVSRILRGLRVISFVRQLRTWSWKSMEPSSCCYVADVQ